MFTPYCQVVIIEKDRHMCELVTDFLREASYTTVCLADGYVALDHARANRPALIITEILLPRMDGLALCRLIKNDDALRGTKVMVLSMLSARERALHSGADAFMMKPIEKDKLLETVQTLIATKGQEA